MCAKEEDADFAKDEKGHGDMMMFRCTKKVKRGLALFLAVLMMLFVTDLSEVKVKADDEEWKSDSIELKSLNARFTVYGDDLEVWAYVVTTDENAVVTYKWYWDGEELVGKTSREEVLTVDEYKSAGEHTLKCEATCGSDTVTHSMTVTVEPADLKDVKLFITGEDNLNYFPLNSDKDSGAELMVVPVLVYNGKGLYENVNYTITEGGNVKYAGKYRLTVAGQGNYTGTNSVEYTVMPCALKDAVVLFENIEKTYDGTTDIPLELLDRVGFSTYDEKVIEFERGTDYTVEAYYISPEAGENKDVVLKFTLLNNNFTFEVDKHTTEKEFTISGTDSGASIDKVHYTSSIGYDLFSDDSVTINLADYLPELTASQEYGDITYSMREIVEMVDDSSINDAKIENGVLTVPLKESDIADDGTIGYLIVDVTTTNYEFALLFNIFSKSLMPVPTGAPILSSTSLTYGGKLSDITLSGSMENDSTGWIVDGTFEWVNPDAKPDKVGAYTAEWIFTPNDSDIYAKAKGTAEITVNKAPASPNMPDKTMKVSNQTDKVGKISLPLGWVWQDADMSLNVGEAVNATAVYNGSDNGNYEVESLVISITRAEADKSDDANGDNSDDDKNDSSDNTTDSGKSGWEAVTAQIDSARDGDTVTVEMNGATTVPSGVFEHLKGRDVKVLFNMGDGITWTVNGKDVTEIKGDINLGVTLGGEAGKAIPVDVINSVTGEHYSVNLTLAYNGEFGFTATLTLNMKAENAGKYANLFYYNPTDNKLEFVSFGQVGNDGNVTLTFTHASDYTIVLADSVINRVESPSTGNDVDMWRSRMIVVLGCAFMAVGTGVFYTNRKKKAEQ